MQWRAADRPGLQRLVSLAAALAFLLLLIRTAWLDDDAYITFRTVDNFLNGYGLRWNIANRVQSYTHPLWMFLMAGAAGVSGEIYYTSIVVSIAISLAAVVLLLTRLARGTAPGVLAVSALLLSKAFVDYSTSGLENPLTHLLLVAFYAVFLNVSERGAWSPRHVARASLFAGLLMLNRLDAGLLVMPALGWLVWRTGVRRAIVPLAAGMTPLIAWELFSVIYYGFPFPNTAYSKLATGVPRAEVLHQGFLYFLDSIGSDPLTLTVIAAGMLLPLGGMGRGSISAGIALYLAYILWVGGDFMSGRFFTGPFVCSLIQIARPGHRSAEARGFSPEWAVAAALVWALGLTAPRPTVFSDATYGSDIEPARVIAATGITDERRYYYPQSGLLTAKRGVAMPDHKWTHMGEELAAKGDRLFLTDAAGFIGYAAGPGVYFIDKYGLGDALIARLPAEVPWRIGHYVRRVPDGYPESVLSGTNVVRDPGVNAYYERLRQITEGPIFSTERLRTIVRMNLGRYQRFIGGYGIVRVQASEIRTPRADGSAWNADGNPVMTLRGAEIAWPAAVSGDALELSLSRNDHYNVTLLDGDTAVFEHEIAQRMASDSSLITRRVSLPSNTRFTRAHIRPSRGDARYALGHIRILPEGDYPN